MQPSYQHSASGCFGVCNGAAGGLQSAGALRNGLDDLMTPADREKKQEIDDMLSEAVKGLTFEERQKQMESLHGVDKSIAEEETFIEASLEQLERQLGQIKKGSVYEMAEQMDPAYVRAKAFRIMFLRGNRYDVKESAESMLRFFEMKLQLFSAPKLVKDITLEDLNEGDIAALKLGFVQIAGKDRSGRVITVSLPGLNEGNITLQNELRSRYYTLMSILEEEENQFRGIVPVVFPIGDMKDKFGGSGWLENAKVSKAIPKYNAAAHLCADEVGQYLLQAFVLKAAPPKMRSRIKLHFGSQTECLYHLSTYGIPQDFLPLDPKTQKICLDRHLKWLNSRFTKEKSGRPSPAKQPKKLSVVNASVNDILVGNGRKSNNMGNQRLRSLVKDLSQAYDNGSKETRKALVDCVINSVEQSGGRFLKGHKAESQGIVWKEMPKDHIRKNVAQTFRNRHRRKTTPNDASI